jgi:PhzF family phenazine biosynthesis protein
MAHPGTSLRTDSRVESMRVPIYQVDAFASELFRGNPAAVCPLETWLPDQQLQAIAAENNLSETAFYLRQGGTRAGRYDLRWFTPVVEVDLCGHATLATAFVILTIRREVAEPRVVFASKSGELVVSKEDIGMQRGLYALDFPARPPSECIAPAGLIEALGVRPPEILASQDCLCVFETEEQVRALAPNMDALARVDCFAVIATAPGRDCDFVSRFFAPSKGIPEDPVTGRAHCTLIPYWSHRLGKKDLFARQISRRGGELWCRDLGARVKIAGHAVKYLEGTIEVMDRAAVA